MFYIPLSIIDWESRASDVFLERFSPSKRQQFLLTGSLGGNRTISSASDISPRGFCRREINNVVNGEGAGAH